MHFEEIHKSDVVIKPVKMKCDVKFSPPPDEPLPDSSHFFAIIAPPGSGKSTLLQNLLVGKNAYYKRFHNIYAIVPNNSRASMPKFYKKLDPKKQFEDLDHKTLAHILERLKEDALEKKHSAILIDDQISHLKQKDVQKMLNYIAANRRHLFCSVWLCSQALRSIPATCRRQMSHMIYFRPRSRMEMAAVSEEVLFLDKKQTEALFDFVFDEDDKHSFMMVDVNHGKFYKRFNEIIMRE